MLSPIAAALSGDERASAAISNLRAIIVGLEQMGIPAALGSCHTALVGGYAIEGHVPPADIRRLRGLTRDRVDLVNARNACDAMVHSVKKPLADYGGGSGCGAYQPQRGNFPSRRAGGRG